MNSSTPPKKSRGTSPRVGAVLRSLDTATWNQSRLAAASGNNRGVLNQLWQGNTSSTPKLIGRLIAVLPEEDSIKLLTAYLEDTLEDVAVESIVSCGKCELLGRSIKVVVQRPHGSMK